MVFAWQKAFKDIHKIQDRWENVPYKVLEYIIPNHSIYWVQMEGERVKTRFLHRNLLFSLICSNMGEDNKDQQQNANNENETSHSSTGGSHLSCTAVKPDSHLAQIFSQSLSLHNLM